MAQIGGMGAAGNLALNDGGVPAERTGLAKNFSLINGLHYNLTTEVSIVTGIIAHVRSPSLTFRSEADFRSFFPRRSRTRSRSCPRRR